MIESSEDFSRREFLSLSALSAASLALAGLSGCSAAAPEKIVPYVNPPEEILPGRPLMFATTMQTPGYGVGLLVESHEGRPTKIEGNPDHPASLGATDIFSQASILTLYDPDRAKTVTRAGQISTWDAFITDIRPKFDALRGNGESLRILTETVVSPGIGELLRDILSAYPGAKWHQYEPVHRDNSRTGSQLAFGAYVDTQYRFENADVVLSLDSDFLDQEPGKLRYAKAFAARRRIAAGDTTMNRLYCLEGTLTSTGAMADHRFALRSSDIASFARALVAAVTMGQPPAGLPAWIGPLAADLNRSRGRSIVIAGESQPPEVHYLAHLLNSHLGNAGKTVWYIEPVEENPVDQTTSFRELVADMADGAVRALAILGANPVYAAPRGIPFAETLARVPLKIHHSLYYDETSRVCDWHVPANHFLESWGDARAFDGTVSIAQPLIVPLYQTRSSDELLRAILGDPSRSNYEIVFQGWQKHHVGQDFEHFWKDALRKGVVADTQSMPVPVTVREDAIRAESPARPGNSIEVLFRPDPTVFDGRWANNSWLQELPKPLTKLVWDNAALLSATTAAHLGVINEDIVEISLDGRTVEAPVWIVPGQAENSITLHLGYGRANRGFDAYAIRPAAAPWTSLGAQVRKTGKRYPVVTTQAHHELQERHMVRYATAAAYAADPSFVLKTATAPPGKNETLYPRYESPDYAWGMAIDLSSCIGCNACVVACQAENNIPTVGKSEAANSREMHWLRIDTYYQGDAASPEVFFEPMLCQHCENAPCELVCPVEATSHSSEGLNEMTYNRCVGTRYCSNNCPYKVRRFNFLQYTEWDIPQFKLLYNPDVSVRSRGVMEKCTYCVQRINRARIKAKEEDRLIRDGDIVTACQGVCPANAITFGNIKDPESAVSKKKSEPRNYGVLAELNTRPRTTYLAKLTNPNPEIKGDG